MALHDLFTVSAEVRDVAAAERYAQQAFRVYDCDDPRLPALAHDVAGFWLLQGYYTRSLSVFQAVFPLIQDPTIRMLVLSNIARAAGGAGERKIYLDAWLNIWRIVDRNPKTDRVCSALLNLAYGAASLDDRERVELAAAETLKFAAERQEAGIQAEAEALLAVVRNRQFMAPRIQPLTDPELVSAAEALAEDFIRALTACANSD